MKIRPRNIPKFLIGGLTNWQNLNLPYYWNSLPFSLLKDFDPNEYIPVYDTTKLVNASNYKNPWKSNIQGYDLGRYLPTTGYGNYGEYLNHYNYTSNIEKNNPYYIKFGEALIDKSGNFTNIGRAWAEAVDALLPPGSKASFFDENNQIRGKWNVKDNDIHGRAPKTFTNLKDYVDYVRNDLILGARHNLFLSKGTRYFYTDNKGNRHWVSPEDAKNYELSSEPVEQGWEGPTYWNDYELLFPKNNPPSSDKSVTKKTEENGTTEISTGEKKFKKNTIFWDKLKETGSKLFNNPNLYGLGRLAGNLINNERVYDEQLKGINPVLKQSYNTYRQVVGDEATKQAYYRRAVLGLTKASRPFTSDADRQVAYMNEAKRIGDELRAQGDLADNAEIKRTSDESNQHQWANIQRATEVANANLASINQANALRHNLLAQKHSAQWTNIDNYLKEIETRKLQKQAELQALDDLMFVLLEELDLLDDKEYINAYNKYSKIIDANTNKTTGKIDWNDTTLAAKREFEKAKIESKLRSLERKKLYYQNRGSIFAKSGTKIEKKTKIKNDDLLYKSTRDVVEHFRKMSKLSSDALNRKTPKIEKLASHPKGKARKYLQGGVAPFTIYTPAVLGGNTEITVGSSSSKSSSKEEDKGKNKLEFVKTLFEKLIGKGLPIDVNTIYRDLNNLFSRAKAFGEELSSDDISLMYLQSMQQLNNIMHSKDIYDKAKAVATLNEALNEYAVTSSGQYVVQNKDGKLSYINNIKEAIENNLTLVTNEQLLHLREYHPDLLLQNGDLMIENIINNGMGINKIGNLIKDLAGNIGSTEGKLEGISKVESDKIKAGVLELANASQLLNGAPDGYYKIEKLIKDPSSLINAALNFIENSLSLSLKAILEAHGGVKLSIISFLTSQVSPSTSYNITPLSGKAAKDANGTNSDSIKSNFLDLLLRDLIGIDREFSLVTKDGITKLYSLNSKYISQLPNVNEDMSIERMLGESKVGSIMDSRLGVTFGDQVVSPDNLKDIMFDLGGGATVVTLPCKYENGHKVVNFSIKDEYDDAIKEVSKVIPIDFSNPLFIRSLSNKLHEKGLDSLLKGNNLDPNMFGHFLVVSAYTTDRVKFNTNSKYIEKVRNPDKNLEERLIKGLSTNKDKNDYEIDIDDKFGWLEGTWDDIYRGNIFIPLNNDPISAQTGWGSGDNIKLEDAKKLAEQYQNFQKSSKLKSSSSSIL